jgi:hypothetical protein
VERPSALGLEAAGDEAVGRGGGRREGECGPAATFPSLRFQAGGCHEDEAVVKRMGGRGGVRLQPQKSHR